MKLMRIAGFIVGFLFAVFSYSAGPPLTVAIDNYFPPFVAETANHGFYGFDIDMMQSICKILDRPCHFVTMRFKELIPALEAKKVDAAVGSIIITPERAARVNFSSPYLLSYSRFIGPKNLASQPFSLDLLKNKTIGIEEGSIFGDQINAMGVRNPTILKYTNVVDIIDALNQGKIDIALMDNPSAQFWQIESSGSLVTLGEPFAYGFGIGIAVNKEQIGLLQQINKALMQYQNSAEFQQNYDRYFKRF